MDGKEFYKYAKACNDQKITIYPKCSNTGKYKIIINKNGHEKEGEEYYENVAHVKQIEIQTPRGPQKVKKLVPSVWDKIFELYRDTCIKNNLLNN
ncbi:hypothetical protein AB9T89_10300 [Flavobacterium oncorhynchi]|uniref:hypothetical protein n=1 Tax=Flavobacterium oncorhynchi TaxID=728056 RepID=UPI00351AACF1